MALFIEHYTCIREIEDSSYSHLYSPITKQYNLVLAWGKCWPEVGDGSSPVVWCHSTVISFGSLCLIHDCGYLCLCLLLLKML